MPLAPQGTARHKMANVDRECLEAPVAHAFNVATLWGLALIAAGIAIRWRTARYDLKDKAISSAFQTARGKRTAETPTALEQELRDITSQATLTGKATTAAGKVAGHFVAQVAGIIALVCMLLGAALVLYGILAR